MTLQKYSFFFLFLSMTFLYAEQPYSFWEAEVKKSPLYFYPHTNIAERLQKEGKNSIRLFGYGSLLNYDSARKTISEESLRTRKPALAFGIQRLFDRDIAIEATPHWGEPCSSRARGMLNLFFTGRRYDIVNGITFMVPLSEIHAICEREEGYDLMPVVCTDWKEGTEEGNPEFFIAYTFSAPKGSNYTSPSLLPRPGYYEMARDAAKQFGLLYYYLWMKTTWMADGKRPIAVWERAVEEGKDETLVYYPAAKCE